MPEQITEEQANQRFQIQTKLESGGDYGCGVLVFKPTEPDVSPREWWMDDHHFRFLWNTHSPDVDVGMIIIDGDLKLEHEVSIGDRLMCW